MTRSTTIVGVAAPISDLAHEQSVRLMAAREGLRLEKSRRLNDRTFGPTLYWLFDSSTHRLINSKSGWALDDVRQYLTA